MNEEGMARLNCSFCGKDSKQVRQLVAGGNGGFICDKCAWLSMVIVAKAKIAAALKFRASSASV